MKKRTSECIFVKTEGTRSSRWKFRPLYARYAADCNGTLKILVTKDRVWGSYGDVYWKLFRLGRSKSVLIFGEFSTLLRCAADQKVSPRYREQNLLTSPTFDYEKQWRFSKFRRRIWAGPKFPRRSWAETPFMNLSTSLEITMEVQQGDDFGSGRGLWQNFESEVNFRFSRISEYLCSICFNC